MQLLHIFVVFHATAPSFRVQKIENERKLHENISVDLFSKVILSYCCCFFWLMFSLVKKITLIQFGCKVESTSDLKL